MKRLDNAMVSQHVQNQDMKRLLVRPFLHSWLLRGTGRNQQLSFLKYLREQQFNSKEATLAEHEKKIAELLRFGLDKVPYYREKINRLGLSVADITAKPTEVLHALPLLDKTILHDRLEDLKAGDLDKRKWHYNTSGGSSGQLAQFVQDTVYDNAGQANKVLFDEWTGYVKGMPKVVLWGSARDFLAGKDTLRTRLGRYLRNQYPLNTFRMTKADMRSFVATINRVRPAQILAYADAAFELARFIEREGLRVNSPKAIMTSATTLYPYMRDLIERVFSAPVFNRYGSREVGDIACECEYHNGLHVNPYTHHVEILRASGSPCAPGEIGEVAVTLLTNFAMPIIRYRIGDMAAWADHPCKCGRHWPLLQEVSGRVNSIIRTSKGTYSSAALMTMLYFKDPQKTQPFTSIRQFQLVQKTLDNYELKLVLQNTGAWELEKERALMQLHSVLGSNANIKIQIQDEIIPSVSGKHQYIWSELS